MTINIYRDGQTWCYAMFDAAGEYDHADTTGANSEAELCAELATRWPDATITRVADVDTRAAAAALGRRGGRATKGISTPRKARAARRNGAKGGRPARR